MSPNMVGLSALLTTTMPKMKEVIESLAEAGASKVGQGDNGEEPL